MQALNKSLMLSSGITMDEIDKMKDDYFNKGREDPVIALQQFVSLTKLPHKSRKAPRDMNPIMRKYESKINQEKKRAKTNMSIHRSESSGRISLLPLVSSK